MGSYFKGPTIWYLEGALVYLKQKDVTQNVQEKDSFVQNFQEQNVYLNSSTVIGITKLMTICYWVTHLVL